MKRRVVRELAIQSLYQVEFMNIDYKEAIRVVIDEVRTDNESEIAEPHKINPTYVIELVEGTIQHLSKIDPLLSQYLKGWNMDRLSRMDREILRLAVYELFFRDDVPAKVAVNEAIELSKHFGTEESGKFVNGVLGKMFQDLDQLKEKWNS